MNYKNLVLIEYLKGIYTDFKFKAEYNTNDRDMEKDIKLLVVQEQPGQKVVFFNDIDPLFNYYEIVIFGRSIQEMKETSVSLGNLIGKHVIVDYKNGNEIEKWQIIFKQYSNPQPIEYMDIRRVGYSMIFQCIVNRVA